MRLPCITLLLVSFCRHIRVSNLSRCLAIKASLQRRRPLDARHVAPKPAPLNTVAFFRCTGALLSALRLQNFFFFLSLLADNLVWAKKFCALSLSLSLSLSLFRWSRRARAHSCKVAALLWSAHVACVCVLIIINNNKQLHQLPAESNTPQKQQPALNLNQLRPEVFGEREKKVFSLARNSHCLRASWDDNNNCQQRPTRGREKGAQVTQKARILRLCRHPRAIVGPELGSP